MDPIETLRNEHGLIRRFVDLLSVAVTRLEVENPPPRAFFEDGIEFVFGTQIESSLGFTIAFGVLPVIVFFAALMSVLYYLGIMQRVVGTFGGWLHKLLGTSHAESVSAVSNIFVGHTDAPLVVRPYLKGMSQSELFAVMTGGCATIAGAVMMGYAQMGVELKYLITASFMAAPGGLMMAKILMPETEVPDTKDSLDFEIEQDSVNVIDAAAGGASDGMRLALNVGAMLIAFLALIALINGILGWSLGLVNIEGVTLEWLLGKAFAPVAWLIGVPWSDAAEIGTLFGVKMVANEFVAFQMLADGINAGSTLSPKSIIIATYALTGFANFSSIAIQIGGIGGIAPERRHDLSRLGVRAMLGGTVATWMTATLAGVLA